MLTLKVINSDPPLDLTEVTKKRKSMNLQENPKKKNHMGANYTE